tara:strand:+ start:39738 stop:40520 length:783 start_codon:yes stop_codon:yes gene_type:complete
VNQKLKNNKVGILDWAIFISIFVMALMIFIPQIIWEEEDSFKKIRRDRMNIISRAEDFYFELMGEYTIDTNELFSLVEAATDSLIADSLFTGKQKIFLNDKVYNVNVDPDFHIAVDTTFSSIETLKYEVTDTIYTISMLNNETNLLDTILINSRLFNRYKNDEKFEEIINSESIDRVEKQSNYLRRRFHLSNDLIYCPISDSNKNKKFILEIENNKDNDQIFKITSPVSKKDRELRYGIFRFNPGNEEYILGGVKSWAEK